MKYEYTVSMIRERCFFHRKPKWRVRIVENKTLPAGLIIDLSIAGFNVCGDREKAVSKAVDDIKERCRQDCERIAREALTVTGTIDCDC